MNRWKVESTACRDFRLWLVFEQDYVEERWIQRSEFVCHAVALAYADRMARTIEVILPRDSHTITLPESVKKEEKPLTLNRWKDFVIIEATAQGGRQNIFVHNDELEPLALALLAHAKSNGWKTANHPRSRRRHPNTATNNTHNPKEAMKND